jgi:hypothetical protein
MAADRPDDFPTQLPVAAQLQARNTEYNLDLTGRVTHLDEKGLVTTFPVEIPAGTVLFSIIDLRTINATVRGLIRVRSQDEASDLGGYRTLADFVDLNNEERRKISRLLGGAAESMMPSNLQSDETSASHAGPTPVSPGSTRPRRPPGVWPKVTFESLIWAVLGLIFYSIVLLGLIALFPQGRAWELDLFHKLMREVYHVWPGLRHLFGLL